MTGTWTSIEVQMAVSVGYVINNDVYVQHHFSQLFKALFERYIDVCFEIKRKAAEVGNLGLK